MKLQDLVNEAHSTARKKGFYENGDRNIGEVLMLVVSELGEALEAHRSGRFADWSRFESDTDFQIDIMRLKYAFESSIKDSFEDEIADTFIRLADLCGYLGIDIERHVREKMNYNKTRGNKHGKNY